MLLLLLLLGWHPQAHPAFKQKSRSSTPRVETMWFQAHQAGLLLLLLQPGWCPLAHPAFGKKGQQQQQLG
jgi:hypothetical protein